MFGVEEEIFEIHIRLADKSMMVIISNKVIRKKIVEQEIWYIGNSLFYVVQWSLNLALKPQTIESIPLWIHFRGVPFDSHTRGLKSYCWNFL